MRRFRWDKKYLYWGVTAFFVIAAAIAFYMLLNHLTWLGGALRATGRILSPFIWGLVIAYLLYPLMGLYERGIFLPLARLIYRKSRRAATAVPKLARGLSVFLAIVSLLVFLGGMLWLVGPQLYSSVEGIVVNSNQYLETVDTWLSRFLNDYPEIETALSGAFGNLSDGLVEFATKNLLPELKSILSSVTSSLFSVAKGIYNIVIGMVVSIYVLAGRERFSAHAKKVLYSVFSLEAAEKIIDATHFMNDVFMSYISGKILDSLGLGLVCYIGCVILRIEYAVLVSVLVGVTNVIPFFGPIFGLVPSALIILMESPMHALVFTIYVLLLQQVEGNILEPKILGKRIGIDSFWVLFSISVGAGVAGVSGMLLGVPVFVIIYTFLTHLVNRKLARSGLPVDTELFKTLDHIDPKTGEPVDFAAADRTSAKKEKQEQRRFRRKEKKAAKAAASEKNRETQR